MYTVKSQQKILVIAVHPDDETLGCGGTLLRHKAAGDSLVWCIVTDATRLSGVSTAFLTKRHQEIQQVAQAYGFDDVIEMGLPTTAVGEHTEADLVSRFSAIISQVRPNQLYLPFKADAHSDHRHVFNAAYACTKSFRYPFIQKVLMMETLSETEFAPPALETAFIPQLYVDISPYLEQKLVILSLFESEIGQHPFPRSLETLRAQAMVRGAQCGVQYAEAFVVLKETLHLPT